MLLESRFLEARKILSFALEKKRCYRQPIPLTIWEATACSSSLSPPSDAGQVLTISFLTTVGLISTSCSVYDSTAEAVIHELIDECQRNIDEDYNVNSLVANEYLKLKMKTLQNAPKDLKKLERLLKAKERECRKAKYAFDIESLVAEIEVLRVIRYLINRNDNDNNRRTITTSYSK
jgi:hypothetical protein